MRRGARPVLALVVAGALTATVASSNAADPVSTQVLRGVTVPVGFGVTVFAELPGLPTSLTHGPDGRVYLTVMDPSFTRGTVVAVDDLGGIGGTQQTVATGFTRPLGITFGPDGALYVSDTADNRGKVVALTDQDDDGAFETRRTVIGNLPNGQHQTNGLGFGPDGMLYVANGNATDDGLECGPEPFVPLECPAPEVVPWSGSVLRVDPRWTDVDLLTDVSLARDPEPGRLHVDDVLAARGLRNIYGLDFLPSDPTWLYTWMNGSDDPSSSEPLYRTNIADTRPVTDATGATSERHVVDDMGFPSCLYDPHRNDFPMPEVGSHDHPGSLEPENNPNQAVLDAFGSCRKGSVTRPLAFTTEGHEGSTGVAFERGDNFPERYDGDLFAAMSGSMWNLNGAQVTGRKVLHVDLDDAGQVVAQREFFTSPFPMDVAFSRDGAMYVADLTGSVYRIEHVADTPDSVTVRMVNGQFVPQVVTVSKRMSVRWVNEDTVPRDVRATTEVADRPPVLRPGTAINSPGLVPPGGEHVHRFGDAVGAYAYDSSTSPTMRGVLVVAPVDR
ncbi:MAG TPA: hypothetical protein VM433_11495 [Mycobacteriales bacterium]|nr:hypothetical protein [Mycobacteriales bacterium]